MGVGEVLARFRDGGAAVEDEVEEGVKRIVVRNMQYVDSEIFAQPRCDEGPLLVEDEPSPSVFEPSHRLSHPTAEAFGVSHKIARDLDDVAHPI